MPSPRGFAVIELDRIANSRGVRHGGNGGSCGLSIWRLAWGSQSPPWRSGSSRLGLLPVLTFCGLLLSPIGSNIVSPRCLHKVGKQGENYSDIPLAFATVKTGVIFRGEILGGNCFWSARWALLQVGWR
jgi:hypothetical protein